MRSVNTRTSPPLADLTTLRIGGRPRDYVEVETEEEFLDVISAPEFGPEGDTPLLVLGGGSNLVVSDAPFEGTVVRDLRRDTRVLDDYACGGVTVSAPAGAVWDDLVALGVEEEWSGLEALSGIPGSVGAAPVQNIGAYGREIAEDLAQVRVFDRLTGRVESMARFALKLGYRDSILKQSLTNPEVGGGVTWGPTGRWVVLDVQLQLPRGDLSMPIRYGELARYLGVDIGERAPSRDVREAVLALRASKGMVLNPADHDTWSAGSFFTNPILSVEEADELLPPDAPRFGVENRSKVALANPHKPAPQVVGVVKTSAAWLINRSGFTKGWSLYPDAPAALSTKHVLALTNRGGATSQDIIDLARAVRDGVRKQVGITLVPEPVFVGATL